jgi:hypothetical protein
MKPPSVQDKAVRVKAYLTDEAFGYDHWRAAQFSAPKFDRHAVLVFFDTPDEADDFIAQYEARPMGETRP